MWTKLSLLLMISSTASCTNIEKIDFRYTIDKVSRGEIEEVSEKCQEDVQEWFRGLNSDQGWAKQMLDSITKFPDGVLMGHFQIPGHFDECVEAVHHENKFTGKHCMLVLTIEGQRDVPIFNLFTFLKFQRGNADALTFLYGLCVPSSCTASDVSKLGNYLSPEVQNKVKIKTTENDCSTAEYRSFRNEDYVTIALLSCIALLAVASTIYDYRQTHVYKNDNPSQLYSSFSIIKNGKMLFKISQSSAQLKCLHGIRFLSICWVVIGHTYFTYLLGSPINLVQVPKFLSSKSFIPISNAFVSVDSFFFLSGLLVCLVFFRDISKKGSFDVPVAFIHRYMRLTPPFAILILIQATIVSRLGNGPFWNPKMDAAENACRDSWWAGILYIQNYVKSSSMCLGQSWYLSADMQMYWLSPLILYPVLMYPVYAPVFIILLILAAALTNFSVAYVNDLLPNFSTNLGENTMNQFELEYVPFHTRMAPWLIGLGTGYIICGLQAKKIRFNPPKYLVIIGWAVCFALLGGSLFGISRFSDDKYTTLEASLYLAFHRVGWALGLSWLVIACISGYGGVINKFLSLDIFQPLAKLSYCTFLIHMTIQSYRLYSSRLNHYLRHFDIVYSYFGDILISNVIAIPLAILIEFPFTHIDRHFFQKLVILPLPKPKEKLKQKSVKNGLEEVKPEDKNIVVDLKSDKLFEVITNGTKRTEENGTGNHKTNNDGEGVGKIILAYEKF